MTKMTLREKWCSVFILIDLTRIRATSFRFYAPRSRM
jgi:hypothetical protein